MNKLEKANKYIEEKKDQVNNRPFYHFSPEIGWMNDPNGFIYYKGRYHLFYQYNPYDVVWDDMHWGHATTTDFVQWEYLPVALANDRWYDANGCFSGSAIEKDGKIYLMYTGHVDPNLGFDRIESEIFERQCIAVSDDGLTFHKVKENPVIDEKLLPEGYRICDFRDPKVFEKDGKYYVVLAVRNKQRRGEILLFSSEDLLTWAFHSSIYQSKDEENILLECPDLFSIDGKDVLLFSVMPCDPDFEKQVQNHTAYVIGKLDLEKGEFLTERKGLLDYGRAFYAPQTTTGKDGERLLIGWMHKWHQKNPPKSYGFNGMMSLPRQLTIENGGLVQKPAIDVSSSFSEKIDRKGVLIRPGEELTIDTKNAGYVKLIGHRTKAFFVQFFKEGNKAIRFHWDGKDGKLTVFSSYGDRETIQIPIKEEACDSITFEWFIDSHSIELFINGGQKAASFIAYEQEKGKQIVISANEQSVIETIEYREFI
ncbi:glycoside hydrolase family 32 protein [Fervidibacillus albus]|uniref:beta-fructofuranosidase n=1 Tax=Fervidibacillus albus TaxID=2980026 RepID=A0A9E8LU38_9BACI|nr:glycoside hydrolase family 32 protein [Fervidibacillus albus]WAA09395.1 glycoside hydrolase family 32 protein [Fervidibacillus albus]